MKEQLIKYRNEGKTWLEIDGLMGVKKGTSWARAKRAGLVKAKIPWSAEDQEYLELYRRDLGLQQIALDLNRSYDYIKRKSQELSRSIGKLPRGNGPPNSNHITKEEVLEAIKLTPSLDSHSNKGRILYAAKKHFGSWSNARIAAGMGLDSGGIRNSNKATLYLIYFPESDLYKIGITQISPENRFSKFPKYEVIDLFQTGYSFACELEQDVLNSVNRVRHPELYRNGETECFKLSERPSGIEDLL